MKKRAITAGVVGLTALTGGGYVVYDQLLDKPNVVFDPAKAQIVRWNKPTTDTEWANDVKEEGFDIKSTDTLTEMRNIHAEKLTEMRKDKRDVFECPECIKFKAKEANPDWSQSDIDAYYAEQVSQAYWELEKLEQSVERMEQELRLRDKGFVEVKGEKKKILNNLKTPHEIRISND